ncbi:kinesin-like protein KIF18A [Thrips palmi]|uniref:Kinesin-like protein KIF18A n=1 Tax=Thrips palmi TaxID=161013 RepID=A0A6P9ACC7_THRPL|nr:kinesin-like protein KIF18A [Thrips palmi]
MALKGKDPGKGFSPARKALSRSGIGLCRSPRRGLSTSFQGKSTPSGRAGARPAGRLGSRPASAMKGSSANMKVIVRVRPMSKRETENNSRVIVEAVDEKMVVFDPKKEEEDFFFHGSKQKGRDMLKKQNKNTQYLFDRVFGPEASNEDVFEGSTKNIVTSVLDGYNCSVFVYGATGAGKTFTMLGSQDNPGITFRTMVNLFTQMDAQKDEKTFEIGVSYLEVYNETVKDLLNPSSGALFLREDGAGVAVAGLKMERIVDPDHMFKLLENGNRNRSQHPTDSNAESSRSHAVFQVFIKMKTKANGQTKVVKLSMIDLAGSERGAATGCTGARFKEGSNINKSLLALGNCINALADGLRHIPYRDSKLTRLLKDSLGGNCQTVMIANLSPAHQTYEDTQNTLKYATRAKTIKFQVKRNIVSVELHVSHYIKMVEDLQGENDRLKSENAQLKKDLEDLKAQEGGVSPATQVKSPKPLEPFHPPQSHLPPAVAAAVAAINGKIKPEVSTTTVGVNTSPMKTHALDDSLLKLKERAQNLYSQKARIHQRYLNMNSSDKVLQLRMKLKQRTIDRVKAMSSTPSRTDQVQFKVDKSLDQFRGRLASVNECQETVSAEESEINQELQNICMEFKRLGMWDEIAPYLNVFELEFLNQELLLKCEHLEKLVQFLNQGYESHDEVVQKVAALFRKYRNLVRGHGHMNQELEKEHEIVMRGLEGMKSVQWNQSMDKFYCAEDDVFTDTSESQTKPSTQITLSTSATSFTSQSMNVSTCGESSLPPIEAANVVLLQSPLCSSSSNPLNVTNDIDTVTMLDNLEDLDSKVENILNTSVSSSAQVRQGCDESIPHVGANALNVTFDADGNLNSTFTKDDLIEPVVNLNETFEKPEASVDIVIPNVAGDNLNGTFSLDDDTSSKVDQLKPALVTTQHFSPTLSASEVPASHSPSVKRQLPSPSVYSSLSPRLKSAASISPSAGAPKAVSPHPSPLSTAGALALKKSSPLPHTSISMPNIAIKKLNSLSHSPSTSQNISVKKPSTTAPSTFAVPGVSATKSLIRVKQIGGIGMGDKRKALAGSNLVSLTGKSGKFLNVNRKGGVSNPKVQLNLNTPNKVKLAWNKENRNTTTVPTSSKPLGVAKQVKPASSTKLVIKPAPISSNETFTK